MTQPVQEVSGDRSIAAAEYRVRQLARRPPPISARPSCSYFRAYFLQYSGSPQATNQTGIGSTNQTVIYDWWETNDPFVFEPLGPAQMNDPVMSTDMLWSVLLKQMGHYTITMGAYLLNDTWGHKQEWNDDDNPFGLADSVVGGGDREPANPAGDIYNLVGFYAQTLTRIYPLPEYGTDPPTDYWPDDMGPGGTDSVEGFVTIGTLNPSGASDNELIRAYLEILFQSIVLPPPPPE